MKKESLCETIQLVYKLVGVVISGGSRFLTLGGALILLFGKVFAENCTTMKEIRPMVISAENSGSVAELFKEWPCMKQNIDQAVFVNVTPRKRLTSFTK